MSEWNLPMPDELDPVLLRAAAALRARSTIGPEIEDRIMAEIRQGSTASAAERRRRVFSVSDWATSSKRMELPGLRSLAIAAGLAGLFLSGVWLGRMSMPVLGPNQATVASSGGQIVRLVEFTLIAPAAARVTLVGDFNGWSPGATPLRATSRSGLWSVTVPLTPGRHEYAFLVDGKHWLPDPRAPLAPGDDFGAPNSVLTVTERS